MTTSQLPRQTSRQCRPVFRADWHDALFIHFRVEPASLQPRIPLQLHTFGGFAWLSLVAFTQKRLRLQIGGRVGGWLSRPLAHHEFLNFRTYVRHGSERGVFFLSEWIPNPLAVLLGPRLYGLPYRPGRLTYRTGPGYALREAIGEGGSFSCAAQWDPLLPPRPSEPGSEAEFLVERYAAFTLRSGILRRFRIEHAPWNIVDAGVKLLSSDLLGEFAAAQPFSTHYSPGVASVDIGWGEILQTNFEPSEHLAEQP